MATAETANKGSRLRGIARLYCDARLGEKGLYHLWEETIPTSTTPLRVTRAERISLARIDDRVLGSVIYLYRSPEEAERGDDVGGTGFLLSVQSETHPNYFHVYAVTNRHVAADPGYAPIVRVTNAARIDKFKGQTPFMAGNREIIPLGWNQWEAHPDADVAIASLGPDEILHPIGPTYGRRFGFTFPSFLLLTHDVVHAFDIGAGDDVYMCGRFTRHAGKYFNEPSTRWGVISLMHSMVKLEKEKPEEEVFLVEMRSLSGFSGSPVCWRLPLQLDVINRMERAMRPESGEMKIGPWLVGIECGSFPYYYPVVIKGTKIETEYEAKSHSGVASVVPAWKIEELINSEKRVMERNEEDQKITERKQQSGRDFDREVAGGDAPLSRESFEEALRRASRKIPQPDEEKGEA